MQQLLSLGSRFGIKERDGQKEQEVPLYQSCIAGSAPHRVGPLAAGLTCCSGAYCCDPVYCAFPGEYVFLSFPSPSLLSHQDKEVMKMKTNSNNTPNSTTEGIEISNVRPIPAVTPAFESQKQAGCNRDIYLE